MRFRPAPEPYRREMMKTFSVGLALLIAAASPDPGLAKSNKLRPTPKIRAAPVEAVGGQLNRRARSPHPEWDVYRGNRYVGTDPDPNVRLMLLRDRSTEYP